LLQTEAPGAEYSPHFNSLFLADGWDDRWVKSKFKSSDEGPWELSAGKYYGDADNKGNAPLADPAPVLLPAGTRFCERPDSWS
jgi:hypothetical protein